MLRRAVQKALGEHPSAAPARRWPDIWRFVGGPVVRLGQYLLNARGYQLATDGAFGAATLAAVQDWQARQGLAIDPDGTFTTGTWETLVSPVYRDGSGPAVAGLQFLLNHKGYALAETGAYDDATRAAVKQLQRLHGLRPTGKVDVTTWCAIAGGTVRESLSG